MATLPSNGIKSYFLLLLFSCYFSQILILSCFLSSKLFVVDKNTLPHSVFTRFYPKFYHWAEMMSTGSLFSTKIALVNCFETSCLVEYLFKNGIVWFDTVSYVFSSITGSLNISLFTDLTIIRKIRENLWYQNDVLQW